MLQPAVQPGSELDYQRPQEHVTIAISAAVAFTLEARGQKQTARESHGKFVASFSSDPHADEWSPVTITLVTGAQEPKLTASWHTANDLRERAFQSRRFFLPWARPDSSAPEEAPKVIPELAGGDWRHGEELFFNDQVSCYKCHQVNGRGARIGPDLSNLRHRDYASVLKDIMEPNAAINPDHLASQIELKNGETITAVILSDNPGEIVLGDSQGVTNALRKAEIASIKPSPLSLMPEGLLSSLNQQQQKDLLTFLLLPKPESRASAAR
jgi:putative heme-binding domain-containing protein